MTNFYIIFFYIIEEQGQFAKIIHLLLTGKYKFTCYTLFHFFIQIVGQSDYLIFFVFSQPYQKVASNILLGLVVGVESLALTTCLSLSRLRVYIIPRSLRMTCLLFLDISLVSELVLAALNSSKVQAAARAGCCGYGPEVAIFLTCLIVNYLFQVGSL